VNSLLENLCATKAKATAAAAFQIINRSSARKEGWFGRSGGQSVTRREEGVCVICFEAIENGVCLCTKIIL
jgi:hypothetical protein